jgi:small subunit ribosomal protein S1
VLKEGQTIEVTVEAVDPENRKLSLSLTEIRREEEEAADTLKSYQQQATEPQNMGSIGDLLKEKMEKKGP